MSFFVPMWLSLLLAAGVVTLTTALPTDFTSDKLIQGLGFITEIDFTPDGSHMYISRKFGQIYVLRHGGDFDYENREMALDLTEATCTNGERGLGSIALHPQFSSSTNDHRWMYVYHTVPNEEGRCDEDAITGATNLLVRYRVNQDMTLDRNSRQVLLESAPHLKAVHNGGRITFGTDGYLYVTTGDGGDRDLSAQTNNLFGGVLRLTLEGEIPSDNPFVGDPDAVRCHRGGTTSRNTQKCLELYAVGLRNPFKMDMDPNSEHVRFMVNDVGASRWEEMSVGGADANIGPKGLQDFGWPEYEGACIRTGSETDFDCGPPAPRYVAPYHFYRHNNGGAAVGSAWIPNGIWPSEYDGGYLYSDFVFGEINLVQDTGRDACYGCNDPLPKSRKDVSLFEGVDDVIAMRFGPYTNCQQALYYSTSCCGGQLHRVVYQGNDAPNTNCGPQEDPPQDEEEVLPAQTPAPTAKPTSQPTALELAEEGGYPGPEFQWSTENCPLGFDYCGILEFCQEGDTYGFRIPCLDDDDDDETNCKCQGMFGPLIRVTPGNKYRFILRNVSPDLTTMTNIHPHGLHIVGDGDGDDVMRKVSGGGNCLDYTWDIQEDHPGGTYWYHSHHHGTTQVQVEGGAFGMFIVEDNLMIHRELPAWTTNERLLQVYHSDSSYFALGNGKDNEVVDIDANQWYRLRVSLVDSEAVPHDLIFHDEEGVANCTIHKVANDGIWRSSVPGPTGLQWEMTGASRGDFAIMCTETNQIVPMTYNGLRVATIRISNMVETNPYSMEQWTPSRPYALRDLRAQVVPDSNTLDVRLGYDYVNDLKWDPMTPLATIAYDQVHEWNVRQTIQHPFHLHLYHMQVVQPGGCGAHEEGEWYDTIAAPDDCLVRFATSDFGQRCILHCHVYFHEDAGSMSWVNVTGPDMPLNEVQSFEYQCPAFLQAPVETEETTPPPVDATTTPSEPTTDAPLEANATDAPIAPTADPTAEPTPTPCRPGYLGLQSGDTTGLVRGFPFYNEEYGVFAQQNSDGNFVVFRGEPGGDDTVRIWSSQSSLEVRQNFHVILETNGQLAIYENVPDSRGQLHWTIDLDKISVSRADTSFFLGVDCTLSIVSVYEGTPLKPGPAIWNSVPTNAPTMNPTNTPTLSPTDIPTAKATPMPSQGPMAALQAPVDDGDVQADDAQADDDSDRGNITLETGAEDEEDSSSRRRILFSSLVCAILVAGLL